MTYRVIQWATGAMGRACLRGVIDHAGLELAGVYVHSDEKVGKDAGDLIRRASTGVVASGSIEEIEAIDADVVIHAARLRGSYGSHDDDIVRLLRSGKNVISINGNTFAPRWSPERQLRIDTACRHGGSSFMGAGLNPGFAAEQLAVVASGVCLDVSHLTVSEVVMCDEMRSPEYVFDLLGFGSVPGDLDLNGDSWAPASTLNSMFEEVVASLCHRLGFEIGDIARSHRMLTTDHDLQVAAGLIRNGTVSHLDWCWRGMVDETPVVELRIAWAMDRSHTGDRGRDTWRIRIDGTPSVNLSFGLEAPTHLLGRTSVEQLGLAGAVLNAIPHVVAAPPGAVEPPSSMPWHRAPR